jgi:tryptophan synthase alpha chain
MRLERITREMRDAGRKALVPFFTAGYPDAETFLACVRAAAAAGCRVFEVGIPFSDPVADGPLIQASSQKALAAGMTLERALDLTAAATAETGLAPVLMSYVNPILRQGLDAFAARAAEAGAAGVILPDVPVEESAAAAAALATADLDLVALMAPTTDPARAATIAAASRGFLYLVSLTGVTGAALGGGEGLPELVARARAATDLPCYVGFGVSTPEQARAVCEVADGVIIGSALIRIIERAADGADAAGRVRDFLGGVSEAIA